MDDKKMEVRTTENELTYTRMFDAPPTLVFEAFSSCEHLRHWWGPRMWPMAECSVDFVVGGMWHYCLRGPNEGDESWGKAIYQEINGPKSLVYRDYFCDKDGNTDPNMPSTLVTYTFIARDGQTQLTGQAEYEDPADLQQVLEMGMLEGMAETLDRLDEHLAQSQE
jgi:uncharacterized protein YndB with AHSA1/START domain